MTVHDGSTPSATSRRAVIGWCVAVALVTSALGACGSSSSGAKSSSSASTPASTSGSNASTASDKSSTDSGSSSNASSGDLCNLVTKSEAEAVTGKSFGPPRGSKTDGPLGLVGGCVYTIVGGAVATTVVNVAVVGTKVTREQFDGQLAQDAPDATAVAGIGEEAKLLQPGILEVFDHGVALSVEIIVDGTGAGNDVLIQVARKALDRL